MKQEQEEEEEEETEEDKLQTSHLSLKLKMRLMFVTIALYLSCHLCLGFLRRFLSEIVLPFIGDQIDQNQFAYVPGSG